VELVDDGLQRLREERALDVARELRGVEVRQSLEERAGLRAHVITLRALDAVATAVRAAERLIQPDNDSIIIIIIIIIEKTDAGLNGLYIRVRDINVLYDFINIYIINTKLYCRQLVPLLTNKDVSLIMRGRLYSSCV